VVGSVGVWIGVGVGGGFNFCDSGVVLVWDKNS
jgi:hypothetical protein